MDHETTMDILRANNHNLLKKLETTEIELARVCENAVFLHETCFTMGLLEYYGSLASDELEQELKDRLRFAGYKFHDETQVEIARMAIDSLKSNAHNWLAVAKEIIRTQDGGASPTPKEK